MYISFILSSLGLNGGVRVVTQYAYHLTKRGHHISVIIPKGTIDPQIKHEIDPDVRIVESKYAIANRNNIFKLIRLSWDMARAVPPSDVIIATHTPTTAVSLIACKVLNRGKAVWFYQDYQEMFAQRPIETWLIKNALRWHELVLTVSEVCMQELLEFYPANVINVGEGLDTNSVFHPVQTKKGFDQRSLGKKAILFVGDSRPRKGMADFIVAVEKAHASINNLVVWIVSKEKFNLQTTVPYELFIRPTDSELANLYSTCDVFVSASWYEGFGLPPLEAMACGAAVVTTDSRGIREFAEDGKNCLVVPPKNPDAISEAILMLFNQPDLTNKLRINGPITAAKFNWDIATDRFEAALQKLDAHS
jgi:glycosyltransferase involved in cell wall biosynthesis